jgi:transposase
MQKDLLYCAIDVSKDKLDLKGAALALPAQLGNDQAGFGRLIKAAKKYPEAVQFVFEATGPYHLELALALWDANIPLSVLNPARVRDFAKAQGKAKTDPLDTQVIGDFARCFRPPPTPSPDLVHRELTELLQRRDSLVSSRAAEQNRLGQCRHKIIILLFGNSVQGDCLFFFLGIQSGVDCLPKIQSRGTVSSSFLGIQSRGTVSSSF